MRNLIENALVHTPPGTRVEASAHAENGTATIEVWDDGPGIPGELRERVFDRFVRGESDGGPAGTGLGLAIVRAVAERHDGSVDLGEAPGGGGTRFVVRLPVAHVLGAGSASAPAPA